MDIRTHLKLDRRLCGEPVQLGPGHASVRLTTTPEMAADDRGLVHGGFVFGLADHGAMLAVNQPNVVLGRSESRFLQPVRVGETLVASAKTSRSEGAKKTVEVKVRRGNDVVMSAQFLCYELDHHVLDDRRPAAQEA